VVNATAELPRELKPVVSVASVVPLSNKYVLVKPDPAVMWNVSAVVDSDVVAKVTSEVVVVAYATSIVAGDTVVTDEVLLEPLSVNMSAGAVAE